jgi:DUF2955 family protein/fusaric acid resistance family protein
MSVEPQETVLEAEDAAERHAAAFRIAVAAAAGFTLGHLLEWDFPFLPSLFAVQLLSASRHIDLRRAFGFVLLMALGCAVSLFLSLAFVDRPLNLIIIFGLLFFLEFLALARGKAAAGVLLITTSFVPLMAISSIDLAYALVHNLIVGSFLALLLIFLAIALFPAKSVPQSGAPKVEESHPIAAALANAAVVMSLFIYFMGAGTPTSIIVIMVTALTILQQSAVAGKDAAFGLLVGNVAGGLAATAAYALVTLLPSPAFLFLIVLFFGLLFGGKIADGGKMTPVFSVGMATFLVVLGLGLSPLPQDSSTLFLSRVSTVAVASLYTIGIASVLRWLFLTSDLRGKTETPRSHSAAAE